ncbi:hypothetical protein ACIRPX_41515 [Streptomyces sp. NPDC101225]|uniref:hypothetical protein n=1 Tax=Streptomyces sp. NPDC101225 TaxID=3366135 RepID=UPI00381BDA6A
MTDDEKQPRGRRSPARPLWGAHCGVLRGCVVLAVAGLKSAAVRPQAGADITAGGAAMDRTPPEVKDRAIGNVGGNGTWKLQIAVLAVAVLVVLTLFVTAPVMAAPRFPNVGAAGFLLFGAVGAAAASTPGSPAGRLLPRTPSTWDVRGPEGQRRGPVLPAPAAVPPATPAPSASRTAPAGCGPCDAPGASPTARAAATAWP